MPVNLQPDNMSVAEKIEAMEVLWESLCRNPADVRSPEWHKETLMARRARLASGKATVSDWSDAKQRLLDLGR
jgi:hypothetical protein